jgi:DNA topoisomerase-1
MLLRDSKRGPFLGCSTFPKCRSTKMVKKLAGPDLAQVEKLIPLLKEKTAEAQAMVAKIIGDNPAAPSTTVNLSLVATDIDCEDCGKPMIIRQGRRGPFLGCSGYPKCKNTGEVPAKLMEELGLAGNNGKVAEAPIAPEVSSDSEQV